MADQPATNPEAPKPVLTLAQWWAQYAEALPAHVTDAEKRVIKRSWYLGAIAVLETIDRIQNDDSISHEEAWDLVDRLNHEASEFTADFLRGEG